MTLSAASTELRKEKHTSLGRHITSLIENHFRVLGDEQPKDIYSFFLAEVEPYLLETVMDLVKGNQLRAAKILGLSRGTLRKKLRQYFDNKYFKIIQES